MLCGGVARSRGRAGRGSSGLITDFLLRYETISVFNRLIIIIFQFVSCNEQREIL